MRVVVLTCDRYAPLLRPFAHLFNQYWSALQPVTVIGATRAPELPTNFELCPTGAGYPATRWTDTLIEYLSNITDERFVLLLEDYFLCRTVDVRGVASLDQYASLHPEALRVDLTPDVLHAHGDARDAVEVEAWGHYDIVEKEPGLQYRVSTQAGIFGRANLLEILAPNVSPWDFEMYTPIPDTMRVFGSRQWPVRYINAMHAGRLDWDQVNRLPSSDRPIVSEMLSGFDPQEVRGE
jgi:hypothetical protein